jgi:hypothetical protein
MLGQQLWRTTRLCAFRVTTFGGCGEFRLNGTSLVLVDVVGCLLLFGKHDLLDIEALVDLILLIFCSQLT